MSATTRVEAVKSNWSLMLGSLLSGAGIVQVGNITNQVVRLTPDTIAEWVTGDWRYDALDALKRLFVAYDEGLNGSNPRLCPWANQGAEVMTVIVANLDGEV